MKIFSSASSFPLFSVIVAAIQRPTHMPRCTPVVAVAERLDPGGRPLCFSLVRLLLHLEPSCFFSMIHIPVSTRAHVSLCTAAETSSSLMLELRPLSSARLMHARTLVRFRNPASDLQPLVLAPGAGHVLRPFSVSSDQR